MLFQKYNLTPDTTIDFGLLVALNKIDGVKQHLVYGHNASINNAALPEDIWEGPSPYPFQTVAAPLSVVSDSTSDNGVTPDVGARTFILRGLDVDYNEISETVTLNGTTPVVTSQNFIRFNYGSCTTGGSSQTNVGTITVSVASGADVGDILGTVNPQHGGTHQLIYTVPNNKKLLIGYMGASVTRAVGSAAVIEFSLMTNHYQSSFWDNAFQIVLNTNNNSRGSIEHKPFFAIIPEKTDLKISCTYADANSIATQAVIQGFLVDNEAGE